MRTVLATLVGLLLAALLVSGVIQSQTTTITPVDKTLYNYGSR